MESETKKVTALVTEEQTLKTEISKLEDEINEKYAYTYAKNYFNKRNKIIKGLQTATDKEEIANIAEESSIVTEYIPKDENNYTVKCKIVEKTETIFEISAFAGSRERAKQISDNWKSNASNLYPKIINLLLNGDKNE